MILLEGCDRVGKTTVARALCRLLPHHGYCHQTKPPMQTYGYFGRTVYTCRPTTVLDRLHWSDLAYRQAYHEPVELTAHQWRLIELALLSQRCHVLYLTDSLKSIHSRYTTAEMWPAEGIDRVHLQYESLWHRDSLPYRSHLNVTRVTLPDLVSADGIATMELNGLVTQEIHNAMALPATLPPTHGLGCVDGGGFMLVGEAPSDAEYERHNAPRVPWDFGPAAEWLWAALDAAQVEWWHGYYTNASAFYDATNFYQYCKEVVKPSTVVALGKTAQHLCDVAFKHGATCESHPWQPMMRVNLGHPQHERRFKRGHFREYAFNLQRALSCWAPEEGGLITSPEIEAVTHYTGSTLGEE